MCWQFQCSFTGLVEYKETDFVVIKSENIFIGYDDELVPSNFS
jgi:hypothetical protein